LWLGLLVGCSTAEAPQGTLARVRARGELIWAADIQGGEPYVYEDDEKPGQLVGFEVDIVSSLARRLGVKHRFVQYNWSNLVDSLERGDYDIAINGLEATESRQSRILLSRPYFIYAETLAVRRGSPYRSLADLKGKRVGTLNQTYAFDLLKASPLETVSYEGVEEPYVDLVAGRTDGVLLDHIIADRYGCPSPEVECVPGDVARGAYVIGMRKKDVELKAAIDGALADMIAEGELQRILTRWKIWDERQTGPMPEIAKATLAPAPRRFDGRQVTLFLKGAVVTLGLALGAFLLAVPLGLLLAMSRLYGGRTGRVVAGTYIEVFRGTPVLLQLYVLYYGLAQLKLQIFGLPLDLRLEPVTAAILGLGLNYAAYEAEVYRGALLSLPRGQSEAASALGLSSLQTLGHVLLPQALRVALPAMTNDFVALLKDTSLVSVITVIELTKRMTIAAPELRGWLVPGLACAALYFAMSFPLTELSRRLERRLQRDSHPRPA
jgi:polar amino acid transport system substrate-binding protein